MKTKQLLLGGLLCAALSLPAMKSSAQVQIGVRAGLNLSNVTAKDSDGEDVYDGTSLNPGFNAGVTFDIAIADGFYVQPAALVSTKGFKYKESGGTATFSPTYIEVPVNFIYKPELGTGRLLLGVGPYVAYGVGGKWKAEAGSNKISGKLEFVNDYKDAAAFELIEDGDFADGMKIPYAKKLDFGGNLLAGYELSNNLSVQLNAQLGLANGAPAFSGVDTKEKFKNVGFGISLGYKF